MPLLARRAADRACARAPRCDAGAFASRIDTGRTPEGRRLHGREATARHARNGGRCGRARRPDARRRTRLALRGRPRRLPVGTAAGATSLLLVGVALVGGVVGAAVLVVAHVSHRGAFRLQPHDAGRCGSPTSPRASPWARVLGHSAAAARAVADARVPARSGGCTPGSRGSAFQLLMLVLYPDGHRAAFQQVLAACRRATRASGSSALLARCGFAVKGLFVMDGSRRSGHGNAYFTGFGRAKRIVFFDTLLSRLAPRGNRGGARARARPFQAAARGQAHRLVRRRCRSRCWRCSAGWSTQPWFYAGLGVPSDARRRA